MKHADEQSRPKLVHCFESISKHLDIQLISNSTIDSSSSSAINGAFVSQRV